MSEELEVKEQEEISDLDYVDAHMKSLGQCLNLLDPDGTFKGMPSEQVLIKIMQAVREDYRKLSDAILALREGEDAEPFSKHNGKLDEVGTLTVKFEQLSRGQVIEISEDPKHWLWFSPQQGLSLLAWLTQERETLERLAKEQA